MVVWQVSFGHTSGHSVGAKSSYHSQTMLTNYSRIRVCDHVSRRDGINVRINPLCCVIIDAFRAPISGGQYHWVSEFAPPNIQKFLSYVIGEYPY